MVHLFYEPEDDVRMFSGDCFVSKPVADGLFTLGKVGRGSGRHSVGKPKGRAGHFVVGRPSARSSQFLLGRPPEKASVELEGGVYVLQMPNGSFYVGKSVNIQERIKQHTEGNGASCARGKFRRVPPLTASCEDLEAWERAEVLARMKKHGIRKVRGWMYTNPDFTESQVDHAFSQVCEKYDLCRRCGRGGHFAVECRVKNGVKPDWAQ
jgi:predicted GIY-YIG superfamily endonuclease